MQKTSWTVIKQELEQQIYDGLLQPGDRLPTEPELVSTYSAGRHSVRRAVAELAKAGKVSVEQGRGTFVEAAPMLTYAISRRTRLRRNLVTQGVDISGDLLDGTIAEAPARVRRALKLKDGELVCSTKRLTMASGVPIAISTKYHSTKRFPDFIERRVIFASTTETYRSYGIDDYLRGETTLHSRQARPEEAKLLRQHPDLPVVVVRAVDTLLDGTPISLGEAIWSGARVQFTLSGD